MSKSNLTLRDLFSIVRQVSFSAGGGSMTEADNMIVSGRVGGLLG